MSDFATIKAELVADVLNSHPATAAQIAAAMVRQLLVLQPEPVTFMEKSGSFSTVADQVGYDGATAGFPKSLLRFDRLYYDLGSTIIPIFAEDRDEIRRLQELGSIAYPNLVAWIEEKLQFGPAPIAVYVVKFDAILDAQKDTATGALLTAASTTQTNGWFTTGAAAYKELVKADYYSRAPNLDAAQAQTSREMAGLFIASLRRTQSQRNSPGSGVQQAPSAFNPRPTLHQRRQAIFPGAPI